MSRFRETDGRIKLPELWRELEELEDGALDPSQGGELAELLNQSPAARRAYLEYFQQSAVLRMEAAKLHERGLLPVAGAAGQTRRIFHRSVLAAAALVLLAAVVAALVVVNFPQPDGLTAEVSAETRWSIDGGRVESGTGPVPVVEGSTVRVESGTIRLELESGNLMVLQGPAEVAFPQVHRPRLQHGWLWIDAGRSKESFRVEAGGLAIRNTGTRFGVRVVGDGPVELHLMSGRVIVDKLAGGSTRGVFSRAGTAFAFASGAVIEEIPLAADPFPKLPELLARPGSYRTTVLGQAPSGYWSLDSPVDRKVANEVMGSSVGAYGPRVRDVETAPGAADGFTGFPGRHGALYFEGDGDDSVLSGLGGLHGVSRREGAVSFWIKRAADGLGRDEILWLAGEGKSASRVPDQSILHTRITGKGRIEFELRYGDIDVRLSSSRSVADGRWHHVVASWGTDSVDLYIDGRLVARDSEARELEKGKLWGRHVRFGKPSQDQQGRFDSFNGWVDEIALWNRPLTEFEVDRQYASASGRSGH